MEGGAAGSLGCRTRCCSAVTNVTASPCPGCGSTGQCYRGLRLTDSGSKSVSLGVVRWPIKINGTGLGVSCGAGATAAAATVPALLPPLFKSAQMVRGSVASEPTLGVGNGDGTAKNNGEGLYAGPGSDFENLGFRSWQQERNVAVPNIGEAEDSRGRVTEPAEIRCV
jgi:hypothetical protein